MHAFVSASVQGSVCMLMWVHAYPYNITSLLCSNIKSLPSEPRAFARPPKSTGEPSRTDMQYMVKDFGGISVPPPPLPPHTQTPPGLAPKWRWNWEGQGGYFRQLFRARTSCPRNRLRAFAVVAVRQGQIKLSNFPATCRGGGDGAGYRGVGEVKEG